MYKLFSKSLAVLDTQKKEEKKKFFIMLHLFSIKQSSYKVFNMKITMNQK